MSQYNEVKIARLAKIFLQKGPGPVSVADIGCFNRPIYDWLIKVAEVSSYVGVDPDPIAISDLKKRNLKCIPPEEFKLIDDVDYCFGLEVIEHIKRSQSEQFLRTLRDKTRKAIIMTTPNFEGWDADPSQLTAKRRPEFTELRYIPDHIPGYEVESQNPHSHKQIMTVEILSEQIISVFPSNEWDWVIYRAWPWHFSDLARNTDFSHYFKLHFAIFRKSLDMR
ncbi:MAG: hypothetical protein GY750_06080 [Lentisphaerae bacterium]|nr:hypothetical protein [Lentisphaerota bacterium]